MEKDAFKPWLTVWGHPRKTIRAVIDRSPKKGIFWLASLYAFQYILFNIGYSFRGPPLVTFIVALLISPILGMLWFYVFGWFLGFTGKWLKGFAKPEHLRAAFAWSKFPVFFNYLVWVILVIDSGSIFFEWTTLLAVMNWVTLALSAWSLVLLILMVAEVQQFSIGKSILNCFLAVLFFSLFPFIISLIWGALGLVA